MKKFKKENKVVRAQAGILVPSSNKSNTSTQPSKLVISPVVPNPYVDPMQQEGTYGGGIDEAYKWLTGKSKNLGFGVKSLADINRMLLPGVASQSDVNKGLADIAKIVREGKSPSSIGVMRSYGNIDEPTADVDKSNQKKTLPLNKESTAPTIPVKRTLDSKPKKVTPGVPPVAPKFSGYPEYDEMAAFSPVASSPASVDTNAMEQYRNAKPSSMPGLTAFLKELKGAAKAPGAPPELAKAAGEIPKTKSGMKKFMDEYGKFIALGAMAGAGGKGGQIAAPIIAALPGLIEMMKKKKSGSSAASSPAPSTPGSMAHGGSMKKSSGGEPLKKSEGGAIRKFKGSSMNTIKYKEGGKKKQFFDQPTTLIPSKIFDQVVSKNPDAAKRMLGRLVYEQNFPSPRKSVKTSPRKYSPSSLEDNSYLSDIEAMGMMRNLEEAPDLPTGSSSTGKFITGIGDLPEAGPSSEVMNMPTRGGNRSIEDAIYSLAKDANIPASSVPKNKSGLKRFFSMIGKGLGIKKKSGSQDEGSQSLSSGGAIRKFKGGSMKGNTMDSTLTPKYAKGGDMPKGMSKGKMGKAAGEMPQHKKMAMGKPTPQSMGQKFAKGGAAKYASGGMCKGYGIAKKIRPTGPMN